MMNYFKETAQKTMKFGQNVIHKTKEVVRAAHLDEKIDTAIAYACGNIIDFTIQPAITEYGKFGHAFGRPVMTTKALKSLKSGDVLTHEEMTAFMKRVAISNEYRSRGNTIHIYHIGKGPFDVRYIMIIPAFGRTYVLESKPVSRFTMDFLIFDEGCTLHIHRTAPDPAYRDKYEKALACGYFGITPEEFDEAQNRGKESIAS